jgi:hypothetical protein
MSSHEHLGRSVLIERSSGSRIARSSGGTKQVTKSLVTLDDEKFARFFPAEAQRPPSNGANTARQALRLCGNKRSGGTWDPFYATRSVKRAAPTSRVFIFRSTYVIRTTATISSVRV